MMDQHVPPPQPAAAAAPPRPHWKETLLAPRSLKLICGALALGAAVSGGAWKLWLQPQRDLAERRYATSLDVAKLYGLQKRYYRLKGVYANDVDSLLALEPDGAALKARMGEHLDLATLTVVGNAKQFKIEANVLNPERTLVKIRGPISELPPARTEAPAPQERGVGTGSDGRPVAPPSSH